jgi:S-disulfanyl-L-cysteine oxidoreductase SoxD
MFNSKQICVFLIVVLPLLALAQKRSYEGIGRTATLAEVKAWDIDVRPDFKGLPKGAGSVALGEQVWEGKCASCHGTFGESNSVFFQLVGFTTKADVAKGNTAALQLGTDTPARTMSMKLPTLSTLWDYINRAMPWNAPKSLTADEVYGVTAFLLHLSSVLPDNFILSDKNMQEVQGLLPNRNGMTTKHAMWPGLGGKPDTQGSACMKDCKVDAKVSSFMPAYAMTAHGDLAMQNREWGSIRGLDTSKPIAEIASPEVVRAEPVAVALARLTAKEIMPILQKNTCTACHAMSTKVLGPSFKDIARKYEKRSGAATYLAGKIKLGGGGVWGAIPMPPSSISETDAKRISQWLTTGVLD